MRFVFIVEGITEQKTLPDFIRRCVNKEGQLNKERQPNKRVGVDVVNLKGGGADLFRKMADKAGFYLDSPNQMRKTIAVVGLLDLYNPGFDKLYPKDCDTAEKRRKEGIKQIYRHFKHKKFKMHFAVHEIEAWLLSQPDILGFEPARNDLQRMEEPEKINFDQPPSKLLARLFRQRKGVDYKKLVHGVHFFGKLDPEVARSKCPRLCEMLDELDKLAKSS